MDNQRIKDEKELEWASYRCSGRTTRSIDESIQLLFELGEIIFPTSYDDYSTKSRNNRGKSSTQLDKNVWDSIVTDVDYSISIANLFKQKIIRRLESEHNIDNFAIYQNSIKLKHFN